MQSPNYNKTLLSSLILSITLAGCASTTPAPASDPWTGWNHGTQDFNDGLDKHVLKPLAQGYQYITPTFVNDGITNFFSNVNDIGVTFNDLFQLKFAQGGQDASRFLINTTAGVGGVMDIANKFDLPKHKEDFGQTLGFWGVPSGNYLVLPFYGPSSPRDTVGLIGDAALNPITYVSIFSGGVVNAITAGARAVEVVDHRAELMTNEKILNEGAVDRYDFLKNSYQQNREYLINDGKTTDSSDPDLLDDSSDTPSTGTGAAGKSGVSTGATEATGTSGATTGTSTNSPKATSKQTLKLSTPKK